MGNSSNSTHTLSGIGQELTTILQDLSGSIRKVESISWDTHFKINKLYDKIDVHIGTYEGNATVVNNPSQNSVDPFNKRAIDEIKQRMNKSQQIIKKSHHDIKPLIKKNHTSQLKIINKIKF